MPKSKKKQKKKDKGTKTVKETKRVRREHKKQESRKTKLREEQIRRTPWWKRNQRTVPLLPGEFPSDEELMPLLILMVESLETHGNAAFKLLLLKCNFLHEKDHFHNFQRGREEESHTYSIEAWKIFELAEQLAPDLSREQCDIIVEFMSAYSHYCGLSYDPESDFTNFAKKAPACFYEAILANLLNHQRKVDSMLPQLLLEYGPASLVQQYCARVLKPKEIIWNLPEDMGFFVGTLSDKYPELALEHLEKIMNGFARGNIGEEWSGDGGDLCLKLGKLFHQNDELCLLRKYQSHDGLNKCECCNRSYLLQKLEAIQRKVDIRADCLQQLNREIRPKKVIAVCDRFLMSLDSDDFVKDRHRAREPDVQQKVVIDILERLMEAHYESREYLLALRMANQVLLFRPEDENAREKAKTCIEKLSLKSYSVKPGPNIAMLSNSDYKVYKIPSLKSDWWTSTLYGHYSVSYEGYGELQILDLRTRKIYMTLDFRDLVHPDHEYVISRWHTDLERKNLLFVYNDNFYLVKIKKGTQKLHKNDSRSRVFTGISTCEGFCAMSHIGTETVLGSIRLMIIVSKEVSSPYGAHDLIFLPERSNETSIFVRGLTLGGQEDDPILVVFTYSAILILRFSTRELLANLEVPRQSTTGVRPLRRCSISSCGSQIVCTGSPADSQRLLGLNFSNQNWNIGFDIDLETKINGIHTTASRLTVCLHNGDIEIYSLIAAEPDLMVRIDAFECAAGGVYWLTSFSALVACPGDSHAKLIQFRDESCPHFDVNKLTRLNCAFCGSFDKRNKLCNGEMRKSSVLRTRSSEITLEAIPQARMYI